MSKDDLITAFRAMWDNYPEQVRLNPFYALFREAFHNVVDIHTSGHADRKTIKQVIETINPKEIICIHKEKGQSLDLLGIMESSGKRLKSF